jgi:predicted secreted protein
MNIKRCLLIMLVVVTTVLLLNLSCTTSNNNQPIITSLEPDAEGVVPLGNLQVVCTASDPDGDELSYEWSASAGEIDGAGDTVTWVAPASEGSYSVAVEVTDGRGGEVMDYVTIAVRANNPPTVASLTANADWTTPSGSVQVTCSASDPDEDALSYEWSASGGDISGTDAAVSWTAPQEVGTYSITVTVTDGYGGEATRSVSLGVTIGTLPTIEQLCVTPKGQIYLRESTAGCDYDVWKGKEYDIECIVSDTNGVVSYEWSCTGGSISGEGSLITWTAPNQLSVAVTVTVTVRNVLDDEVTESIDLCVPSCTCGSWGLESGCK